MFCFITVGMLCFYDYQNERFILPVFVFLLVLGMQGYEFLTKCMHSKMHFDTITIFFKGIFICYITALTIAWCTTAVYVQTGKYNKKQVDSEESIEVFTYINENIDDNAIICFFKPRVLYYYTNVYSYTWFNTSGHEDIADYILLTQQTDENK